MSRLRSVPLIECQYFTDGTPLKQIFNLVYLERTHRSALQLQLQEELLIETSEKKKVQDLPILVKFRSRDSCQAHQVGSCMQLARIRLYLLVAAQPF